jgi:TP901-1 family phage major tail protein
MSGGGLFKDQASDALTRSVFFASDIRDWQVTIPDFGTVTGPFQITRSGICGRHDGEMTFEIALESAGALTFAGD